jgi:phosphate starvation-inducible PhoH-like protein
MGRKTIHLLDIDLRDFYGPDNANWNVIQKSEKFENLAIFALNSTIEIDGDDADVIEFENKINQIKDYIKANGQIYVDDVEGIVNGYKRSLDENLKDTTILHGTNGQKIRVITPTQSEMLNKVKKNDLTFAIGAAGTGKTYLSIAIAVRALKNREVKKLIISRPAVEAGEKLGFLPGDLKEKLDPYLQAIYDALADMIPAKKLEDLIENRVIQIAPLAYMRGRTLDNAFVVLDEAQNTTTKQLQMFLTRMGKNAKFIVTGDISQTDLPNKNMSGLKHATKILKGINNIAFVNFNNEDIVRHRLVKEIVKAYEKDEQKISNKN